MALDILIVDDNPDITTLLSDIIGMSGHNVSIAQTGEEAKKALDNKSFDLMFCDITLPDISGWQVIEYASGHSSHTAVAVISGLSETVSPEKKDTYNIETVVRKPFKIDEIQSVLSAFSTS